MDLPICMELKKRSCKKSDYYDKLQKLHDISAPVLEKINSLFSGYTNHGMTHSYNVAQFMGEIIGNNLPHISDLELYITAACALLHDFGMIVSDTDIKRIKNGDKTLLRYGSFDAIKKIIANGDERIALQYLIRKGHGDRLPYVIEEYFSDTQILFMDYLENSLKDLIISLCQSHVKDNDFLVEKYNIKYQFSESVDAMYIASLLRIADLLDISSSRAPERIYNLLHINESNDSRDHWLKNMALFSGEKIEKSDFSEACCDCDNYLRHVCLYGYSYNEFVSKHGKISERQYDRVQCEIIEYKNTIEKEISACNQLLYHRSDNNHQLYLDNNVQYICHERYRKPNFRIDINYETIVHLLLGEAIYGDKKIGLREILQNGMDACKYKITSMSKNDLEAYAPTIIIDFKEMEGTSTIGQVEIYDTGIGMDRYILENYFLNIGKSLYTSNEYKVSNRRFLNTGYYGIGFFSSFMLSEDVEVYTRLMGTNDTWHVVLNKNNRYACIEKSLREVNGTAIILSYNDFQKVFPTIDDVRYYIEANFLADINSEKKIVIKIRKGGISEEVPIPSIKDLLRYESLGQQTDISQYMTDINCQVTTADISTAKWYIFTVENNRVKFIECHPTALRQYKEITYIKLFFGNSYLFVPPQIDKDPFLYNGDRQRAFNLLTERIMSNIDYTLKDFLDDNGFEYPSLNEIPPAYIGKFYIYSKGDDTFFLQKDVWISNPEPDGGVVLVGETLNDIVYVRNVRIPKFHVQIPYKIYMMNNVIMPRITRLLINVIKEGVNPILSRNDLNENDKRAISYAIGYAIASHFCRHVHFPATMKYLIDEIYNENSEFTKKCF